VTAPKTLYAEDVGHYWRTSERHPDTWLDMAKKEIAAAGGTVLGMAMGTDEQSGRTAYMLAFTFGQDRFKAVWPALPSRSGNERAARVQAATMLYYDVKARCLSAKVLGTRAAFFNYLLLPDGRTTAEVAVPELSDALPRLLAGPRALS